MVDVNVTGESVSVLFHYIFYFAKGGKPKESRSSGVRRAYTRR